MGNCRITVESLIESARCLGIAQERNHKHSIGHWESKVDEYCKELKRPRRVIVYALIDVNFERPHKHSFVGVFSTEQAAFEYAEAVECDDDFIVFVGPSCLDTNGYHWWIRPQELEIEV